MYIYIFVYIHIYLCVCIVEFLVYIVTKSRITLSKVYIRRTSTKDMVLGSYFLDVVP